MNCFLGLKGKYKMKVMKVLLVAAGGFLSPQLLATPVSLAEWGTLATVVSGSCPDNNCSNESVLYSAEGITVESTANGHNQVTSETGPVLIDQGTAQSSSEITGGLATPILKVKASSNADSWIGAGAYAIQGYEYTGLLADTVSFDINFDGMITNPDDDSSTGFGVGMYLFSPQQIDSSLLSDPSTVLGALAMYALLNELDAGQIFELNVIAGGVVNASGQISIGLNPGDQFYLAGGVLAAAGGSGAVADAYSTLSVEVDPEFDSRLLNPAGQAAVPEPAGTWLLMLALIGLTSVKRANVCKVKV